MADWSKPTLTDSYSAVMSMFKDRDVDAAVFFDTRSTAPSNPISLTKRWNHTDGRFECYSSNATWNPMVIAIVGGGTGASDVSSSRASLGVVSSADLYATYPTSSIVSSMISTHNSLYAPHGASVTAVASRIPLGDANGKIDSWITRPTIAITYVFDGGASTITPGASGDLEIPFSVSTISAARIFCNSLTQTQIDVWKVSYAGYPPSDSDSMTSTAPIRCGSSGGTAYKTQDTTLSGWTKTITEGDVLRFVVDSNTNAKRITATLLCTRT
jgi:hypothetical protein